MQKDPLFSVIIPVFNREQFIERSIRSVLTQGCTDLEVICIDNGSTDRTAEIVEALAHGDSRLRLLRQENKGRCAARNRGLEEARGEWVCFLDSDDFFHPHHLLTFREYIHLHPSYKAFASTLIHSDPLTRRNQVNRLDNTLLGLEYFTEANPISVIQLCFHRLQFARLRFEVKEDLPIAEDWLFLRELVTQEPIFKFNRATVEVGEHPGRSMRTSQLQEIARCNIRSCEIFLERHPQPPALARRILSHGYLLGAHIYLAGGHKQLAWHYFTMAARFGHSYKKLLFYTFPLKFIFRKPTDENPSK